MNTSVSVSHTFEAAHRLPHLPGKCQSLHGHSWRVQATVVGHPDSKGVLVEFASLKRDLRGWVDTHLDHGTMLGVHDPLTDVLQEHGTKVFTFDGEPRALTSGLWWPTVENVAALLARVTADHLLAAYARGDEHDARVAHVTVQETSTNSATWSAT